MKKALITLLLLGAASLTGGMPAPLSAQNPAHTTYWNQQETLFQSLPASPDDIIMLGNSITDGGEWAELLGDPRIRNRGISGDTTQGILDRLATITRGNPAKVFLLIGINDFAGGLTPDQIARNIDLLIRRFRSESPATRLFVQSILPVNDLIPAFPDHKQHQAEIPAANALIQELCQKHSVTYIDLYSHFVTGEGKMDASYTNDGLHLLGPGYALWASLIKPLL